MHTLTEAAAPARCPTCGEALTGTHTLFGRQYTHPVLCRCGRQRQQQQQQAQQRQEQQQKLLARRQQCFQGSSFQHCTFAADDGDNPALSAAMRRYAGGWATARQDNMGLLLHGPNGTGKSFYAAAIANAVIEQGHSALMTNFAAVVNHLQGLYEGRQGYIAQLARVPLLVLDDLGAERQSSYMQEQVFHIVDARYTAAKPLIVTTNLPIEEIVHPQHPAARRIYDRLLEMCHPVRVQGGSRRVAALKRNHPRRDAWLGIGK